ncbi:MAG: N-acetyltransferase [Streptococcaceae bacterium]|jgi:predicted GNAT family acetyltransferase|nr:N-acetyltransferase [Streptococcaceae bacterium]
MDYRIDEDRIVLVNEEGNDGGEITWALAGDVMIIDHTFVDPTYRSGNYASELVKRMVDYARDHSYEVLPLCPYARSQFQKHPEYDDVLRK